MEEAKIRKADAFKLKRTSIQGIQNEIQSKISPIPKKSSKQDPFMSKQSTPDINFDEG